jgi:UPF0755 protein
MAKKRRKGKIIGRLILLALVAFSVFIYMKFFRSNTGDFKETTYIYLKKDAQYENLIKQIKKENVVRDLSSFESMAKTMNLQANIHPGKYKFKQGMSNYTMIKKLRSGDQEVVKIVVNKLRTKKQIAEHLADKIEANPKDFLQLFDDNEYLKQFDLDSNNVQCLVMPYTYDVYWNTSAADVMEKMAKAYRRFWTNERKQKAKSWGLSQSEVITIASIVDEETNQNDEKGNVASVYLNRIKKGMKLQADPTARFGYGDFTIHRVLNKHIRHKSPWNTYVVEGIPPGPICTPQPSSITAVLNAPKTDYIFFCAKEDFSGYHNFATNGAEHEANARKFREAMNKRGIRR